jgi:hypothetical protein
MANTHPRVHLRLPDGTKFVVREGHLCLDLSLEDIDTLLGAFNHVLELHAAGTLRPGTLRTGGVQLGQESIVNNSFP